MKDLTEYDQLTGLYNRDKYAQVVERFIQEENENKQITILLIDLDDFKHINDTLGHSTGDQLLINVSNKLRELFLPDHDLFRLGGDEFVVLITHAITRDETINICQNIIQIIKEPISIGDHQLYTSASIGIAFYPEHATDSKFLLKQADLAMYRAKNEGKNNYFIYSKEMMDETIERIEMQKSLRHAVENQEFTLYYQPQIDVLTNDVVGVEALLRWYHPTKGFVSPLEFIPIAEETGMIQEIGEWVLRKACEQFSRWKVEGYEVPISVNLSAKQFKQVNLSVMIQDIIEETNMDPTCLTIEITESTSMEDVQFTISLLEELQNKGIEISIDDFGTGYSSLSYLQKLPINCLKIDRSFIQGIESRTNGIALVKTIIDLAENLNFSVIAEGVETIEQRDILSNLGCHKIQGFVYSKPITAEEIMSLMNNKIAI
nr:EAL domain-containing protein [Bacillus suaedaesalsae]